MWLEAITAVAEAADQTIPNRRVPASLLLYEPLSCGLQEGNPPIAKKKVADANEECFNAALVLICVCVDVGHAALENFGSTFRVSDETKEANAPLVSCIWNMHVVFFCQQNRPVLRSCVFCQTVGSRRCRFSPSRCPDVKRIAETPFVLYNFA